MGQDLQFLYIVFRDPLHPYGLPDPALRRIEHPARVELLLSPAGRSLVCVIKDTHEQFIFSFPQKIRHVKGERQISAPVPAQTMTVPPDCAAFVHSTEMEQESCSLFPAVQGGEFP